MANRKADNLLLFKSIVDSGSLSTAAKICNISISQASKRMTHLESSLGVKLLHRSTRRLSLTPPGEILFNKLEIVKQQIDEAWESMLEYGNAPRGNMRVAASHYYGLNYLIGFIKKFNERHQQINVELHLTHSEQDNLESSFDIAFQSHILGRGQMIPDSNLTAKQVLSEPLVFVASRDYLKKHGTPVRPEELNQHKCLTTGDSKKSWVFYQGDETLMQSIDSSFEANNFTAIFQAAQAGMGVALIPQKLLQEDNSNTLVKLFSQFETEELQTFAYYNANQLASKKVNMFLQKMTTSLDREPEQIAC